MKTSVFWKVAPYRLVKKYQYIGATFASILKVVLQHPEDRGTSWLKEVWLYINYQHDALTIIYS